MKFSFEKLRCEAYRLLGDAADCLRDLPPRELTSPQYSAVVVARRHIAKAKDALNAAA